MSEDEQDSHIKSLYNKSMILPHVKPLLTSLRKRNVDRDERAKQRQRVTYKLRVKGVTDQKVIEHELAIMEYEQQLE
jgi:hypothetical protein